MFVGLGKMLIGLFIFAFTIYFMRKEIAKHKKVMGEISSELEGNKHKKTILTVISLSRPTGFFGAIALCGVGSAFIYQGLCDMLKAAGIL